LHVVPVGVHDPPLLHVTQLPPLHTRLLPHVVPFEALVPRSVHIGEPEEHDWLPLWQGLLGGVHVVPEVQETQLPALQTRLLPHDVPFETVPVIMHTELPLLHTVLPVWHMLPFGVQALPAVQGLQLPPLHTRFVPQLVPFARLLPVSVQLGVPDEQLSEPVWQGAVDGVQLVPAEHAMHWPALHTMLVPHDEPLGAFPLCMQVATPVEHDVTPALHVVPVGVQVWLAWQGEHVPLLQTMSWPQVVPLATFVCASLHTGAPPEHDWVPLWQGLAGWQAWFATHVMHEPLLQTMLVPQFWPLGALPISTHTDCPVSQTVWPVRHGLFVTGQLVPAVQSAQLPW
jgi:hypothetical protein